MNNIIIEKPYLIIVEGKTDEIIIKIILNQLENFNEEKNKIQILAINGKDKLKVLKNLIISSNIEVFGLLIIFDKDDNFDRNKQKIENFFYNVSNLNISIKDYLILPSKEEEGIELEDYICNRLKNENKKLESLEDCIRPISSNKKFGKKLFYSYLILNDDCNYEGTSISSDIIKGCLYDYIDCFIEIKSKLEEFLSKIQEVSR